MMKDYKRAKEKYLKGEYKEALALFLRELSKNLDETPGWESSAYIGYCYRELEDRVNAIKFLKESHRLAQLSSQLEGAAAIATQLGEMYVELNEPAKALEVLEFSPKLLLNSESGVDTELLYSYHITKGISYSNLGEHEESLKSLTSAEKQVHEYKDPEKKIVVSSEVLAHLATEFLYLGRLDEAWDTLERIEYRHLPDYMKSTYHYDRGCVLTNRERFSESVNEYRSLFEFGVQEGVEADAYFDAGYSAFRLGLADDARKWLSESLKYVSSHPWLREKTLRLLKNIPD